MGAGLCSMLDLDEKLVEAEKLTQKPQQSMDTDEDVTQNQEEELKRQHEEEEKRKAEEVARVEEERQRQRQRQLAERQKEEELRVQQEQEKRLAEKQRQREEKRRIEVEARRAEEARVQEIEEKRLREKKKADGVSLENFLAECGGLTDVNEKKKGNFGKYSYPLHIAVKQCNAEIVRILLENKADKTLTTSSGQTALDKAKKYNADDSHQEVIRLLSQ